MLPGELGLLLLLVAVLAVVHHPGYGRIGLRGDLDEVEVLRVRVLRAPPSTVLIPSWLPSSSISLHPRSPDRVVDPVLRVRADGLDELAVVSKAFTKLSSILLVGRQNRCKQRPVILVCRLG